MTEDKLDEMIRMQREVSGLIEKTQAGRSPYPESKEERIEKLCTAIIHEAVELQRLTNWKWWKRPGEFDEKEARKEVIDIGHFWLQVLIELGMTPQEIRDTYAEKNQENRKRQETGY